MTAKTISISPASHSIQTLRTYAVMKKIFWGGVNGFIIAIPFILYGLDILPIR